MSEFRNPLQSEFDILYVVWDRIKKEGWRPGPYMEEPDYIKLLHKRTKYICYIKRTPFIGSLCGYVEVNRNHAMYERDYMNLPPGDCAHGGVTFSGHRSDIRKRKKRWSYGFDCAHAYDFPPAIEYQMRTFHDALGDPFPHLPPLFSGTMESYRDVTYVMKVIDEMAIWMDRVDETVKWANGDNDE